MLALASVELIPCFLCKTNLGVFRFALAKHGACEDGPHYKADGGRVSTGGETDGCSKSLGTIGRRIGEKIAAQRANRKITLTRPKIVRSGLVCVNNKFV